MLVVLASRHDEDAAALAARWGDDVARLLTPADLSLPGWRYMPGDAGASRAVVGGHVIATAAIAGVLTFMPAVVPAELDCIVPEDRNYIAAEMNAFLFAWLSSLQVPVINRPENGSLCGPAWPLERWRWTAASAGLRIWNEPRLDAPTERVGVVRGQPIGEASNRAKDAAVRLATAVSAEVLTATFCREAFVLASARPDPGIPGLDRALLDAFAAARS